MSDRLTATEIVKRITATGPNNDCRVLEMIDENPHIGQRVVSGAIGVAISFIDIAYI